MRTLRKVGLCLLEKAGLDETIVKYSLLNLSGLSCDASAEMNNRLSEGI